MKSNEDAIIRMARDAGLIKEWMVPSQEDVNNLKRFADLVNAAAIRARGQDPMPLFDDWPGGFK